MLNFRTLVAATLVAAALGSIALLDHRFSYELDRAVEETTDRPTLLTLMEQNEQLTPDTLDNLFLDELRRMTTGSTLDPFATIVLSRHITAH